MQRVAAVILDVVCGLGGNVIKLHKPVYLVVMAAAFIATVVFNVNVIYIILAAACVGVVLELIRWIKEKNKKKECSAEGKEEEK